jgi:hypothetical protein
MSKIDLLWEIAKNRASLLCMFNVYVYFFCFNFVSFEIKHAKPSS